MTIRNIQKHRAVRWSIQIFLLLSFVFLSLQTRHGISARLHDIFFRFDPLLLIVASIASRTVVTSALLSILLVVSTLILGRFFCGFVCPLGTTIDIFDSAINRRKNVRFSLKNGKYFILLFLLISAIAGSSFIYFFDPLVIFERFLTVAFHPIITHLTGLSTHLGNAIYTQTITVLVIFGIIIGLGFVAPRFWCRNLCPLGAIFAILSRPSMLKFSFHKDCSQCGICKTVCPTGAIDPVDAKIDPGECISCFRCRYECPNGAIEYGRKPSVAPFNMKRRQLIAVFGVSILAASLSRLSMWKPLNGRLIRPPGSIPEPGFLNLCIRCGKCMKVCPTNGLHPSVMEAGINGIWTPRLIPRIGGCEKNCNMCGRVCPTSAIRTLPLEEKTYVKIGTAVIDRNRCIVWRKNRLCLICDEVCPYNAIRTLSKTIRGVTLLRPFVDEAICIGCGLCESRCPTEGSAAIRIFSIGEERKKTGSYVTEEKIKLRAYKGKPESIPSGFILDNN